MLVQFEKPYCIRHQLPFEYICMKANCKCSVRMCSYCVKQHQRVQDFQNEIVKESEKGQKLELGLQFFPNCYGYLEKYQNPKDSVSSFDEWKLQSKQIQKEILLALKSEKEAVIFQFQQFNSQYFQMKKIMKQLKNNSHLAYLSSITQQQLAQPLVYLSSEKGLQKIRKTVKKANNASKKYQEILNEAKKYGNSKKEFLNGLGFQQINLLKSKIKMCLDNSYENVKKKVNQDKAVQHFNHNLKFKNIDKRRKETQIRRDSGKKMTVVTTSKRGRAISGKQN